MSAPSSQEPDCGRLPDAAAYALGALDAAEAQAFAAHLATCAACAAELAALAPVAEALAHGVPGASAPTSLRGRIMAAVYRDDPPPTDAASADAAAAVLTSEHAPGENRAREVSARAPARRFSRRRLLPALATTLALGVGLLIGAFAINAGSSTTTRTQVIRASVAFPGHSFNADLHKVGNHLQLVVEGMPAPPPGRIYEVWLEHGSAAPLPTDTLFSVTKTGDGAVGVPGNLEGVSAVLVTDEPLGGSLKPTRNPVIVAKF
jgi:hypothetical protein